MAAAAEHVWCLAAQDTPGGEKKRTHAMCVCVCVCVCGCVCVCVWVALLWVLHIARHPQRRTQRKEPYYLENYHAIRQLTLLGFMSSPRYRRCEMPSRCEGVASARNK